MAGPGGSENGGWIVAIDKELLDILACPKCKGEISLNKAQDGLLCFSCKLLYEIEDDIPIMLIDEAKPFDQVPKERLRVKAGPGAKKAGTGKKARKAGRKRTVARKPATKKTATKKKSPAKKKTKTVRAGKKSRTT